MEQAWQLHPSVEELAQSWSLNIARIAYQGGRWIGLDASGKAVIAFNREAQDWSVSEFVPTSCLDEEQNQEVINQFLEDYGYTSLEDAVSNVSTEFFRAGLSIVRNGGEFYRQMWYMGFDMKIIGGYAFSLEHQPGFNNGDIAVCLLSASPNLGSTVAPILLGLERHGTWSQANVLMVAGASQSVSGQRIDLPHLEDALAWIQASRNRVIDPLILLRFDRLNWEKDPSWHVGYEATLPLLKNPDGYIMRYTQNPTELGPRIKGIDGKPWGEGANLYRVISELNRDPGGDIGLFAWQITLLP